MMDEAFEKNDETAAVDNESRQILVVDDLPANLKLLTDILSRHGYHVRPAATGQLALRSAMLETPDLVILDVKMPEMDGYEVCRRLKADYRCRRVPVIFVSALGDVEDKIKGFSAGGVDYIAKPFDEAEVVARVANHIRLRQLQRQLEMQNELLQREIAERRRAEEKLKFLLVHDSLTGIYNRNYFQDMMKLFEEPQYQPVGMIVCDVDNLKAINDNEGHLAGDKALVVVARILESSARADDIAARIGGDEFAVLMPCCNQRDMDVVCEKIRTGLARYNRANPDAHLGVALGCALGGKTADLEDLFRQADAKVCKQKGQRVTRPVTRY